ncbi:hypothetical protein [Sphingomonas sp. Leaf257]|jgi:hypothetical protein|uniref:hypothetical protein n=1 Tax=Sphingomonas sp. Leaf257 TaxID=1736309 RepID=UPI0006F8F5CB|nr:hypothetical protein [Sphingomonas sp. Leaf257]KQO58837.1 hypothetical protein ASF14_02710 [Sphingomonas sp. Leaf257]
MTQVAAGYAAQLKAPQRELPVATASAARFPKGRTITSASPFATEAGAQAEGARLAAFYGYPLVEDVAIVAGARADLQGRCIVADCTRLDYRPGDLVFVIGAQELDNGTTSLTILKRVGA